MAKARFLVVPAAGLGSRMKAVDPERPKELVPLGAKPAIHYTLEEGRDAGVEAVIVILNRAKEGLRAYLEGFDLRVTVLYQDQPTGESDAIALAEPVVGEGTLAIVYPDNVCLPCPGGLRRLFAAYEQHGVDVLALTRVTAQNEHAFSNSGRVDLVDLGNDLYRIRRLGTKRPGGFQRRFAQELRSCGMTVCGPHVFEAIRRTRPAVRHGEFTDESVHAFMLETWGMLGLCLPGEVFDIGNPRGYRRCLDVIEGASTGRTMHRS